MSALLPFLLTGVITAAFHWVCNTRRATDMLKSLANTNDNSSGINFSMLADIASILANPADSISERRPRTSLAEISLNSKALEAVTLTSTILAEDDAAVFIRSCCCLSDVILSLKLRLIMLADALLSVGELHGQNNDACCNLPRPVHSLISFQKNRGCHLLLRRRRV